MLESFLLSLHLVRRNWTVYRKDFLANVSPTVAEPAFMILSLGVGLGAFVNQLDGRSYLAYLAPGLAVSTALFTAFFETSYGFFVRMTYENIFKAMLTTPIGVSEIVIGEFLWVCLKGAFMVLGVSIVLMGFGLFPNPWNLLLAPWVGVLMALPLGAIGLLSTCYVKNINQFQTVYSFLISPLYFFSGIFFPIDKMPESLQWAAKALPLSHGVALSQSIFWNERIAETWSVHVPILLLQSLALVIWAFFKVRQKLTN